MHVPPKLWWDAVRHLLVCERCNLLLRFLIISELLLVLLPTLARCARHDGLRAVWPRSYEVVRVDKCRSPLLVRLGQNFRVLRDKVFEASCKLVWKSEADER